MAYLVNLTVRAERDLAQLYGEINAEHSDAALEKQPNRCPVTPESDKFRHLLYGNKPHIYRTIFRILERQKQVEVAHPPRCKAEV
jgi:toxin ParE1/3/4